MPLVSIVVPIYKVEKLLPRCVKSLREQTWSDIEIILVDDGSPDQCPAMCDQFAENDYRIKVVHKPNGGLSSARNAGLEIACGKYVGFVDSDDDVELSMYEQLVRAAEQHDADFVMCDHIRVPQNGESYLQSATIEGGLYDKERIKTEIFPQLIMGKDLEYGPLLSVWQCLYKRQFLVDNALKFDEEVRWSEDNIFSSFVGYYANRFYYLRGEGLYHYYSNPGTITTSYRKGAWDVYSLMNQHLRAFFSSVRDYDFGQQLKKHLVFYACNCIGQELNRPSKEAIKEIRQILNTPALKDAFCDFEMPEVGLKLKIQLLLMKWKQAKLLHALRRKK